MNSFISKSFAFAQDMPPWAKGVTAVGGILIFGFAGFSIYNKLDKAAKRRQSNMLAIDARRELADLSKKGVRPTITQTQAEAYSSSLVQAFDEVGTDEDAVYQIMGQMKNIADVLFLIQVYGVRSFKGTFTSWFSDETLNLPGAISYEMSTSEIDKINGILSKAGITYKF